MRTGLGGLANNKCMDLAMPETIRLKNLIPLSGGDYNRRLNQRGWDLCHKILWYGES